MKASPCRSLALPIALVLFALPLACGGGSGGGGSRTCDPMKGACATVVAAESQLVGGGLARGQLGDIVVENDEARFVIQRAVPHIALVSQFGGNIIDADVRRPPGDPGRDVFGEFGLVVNFAGTVATESVEIVEPGGPGKRAVVVARGGYALNGYVIIDMGVRTLLGFDALVLLGFDFDQPWPLRFEVRYTLVPGSRAVRVEFKATNTGGEPVPFILAYFAQGGHVNLFVPGERAFDSAAFGAADTIYFESNESDAGTSYAIVPDDRHERLLFSMLGASVLVHELYDFSTSQTDTIPPGGSLTLGSYFAVGEDIDQAIDTARAVIQQPPCSPVLGRVEEEETGTALEGVDVTSLQEPGALVLAQAVTNARTGSDGLFRLCLPAGEAALIAGEVGRPYFGGGPTPRPVRVDVPERTEEPASPDVTLRLPQTARLRVTVTDSSGEALPSRLLVLGIDPSPFDTQLDGDGFDPVAPGVVLMEDSAGGSFDVLVEPGDVDVVVSRGVEYSLFRQPMVLSVGETRDLAVRLHRVVETAGFLSGDFHVHSAPGPDSTLTYRKRVVNMLAEGVDVIVSTDHDYLTDYGPTIREMGVEGQVATITGQEITTFATGHYGAFPLAQTGAPDGGAVNWIGLDPVQIADRVTSTDPEAVFQIMHARAMPAPGNVSNYFVTIDLVFDENGPKPGPDAMDPADARLPATAQWLTPKFNAMEIVTFGNVQGLSDWFNLLNAGYRLTGTGNSDSHTRWVEASGYARNLIRVGEGYDDLSRFDAARFVKAVRDGKNSVTLGPFVDMTIRKADGSASARVGETLDASGGGGILIDVAVESPAWLVSDRLTIYENGLPIQTLAATPSLVPSATGEPRNEFHATVPHAPARDAFYVAVATGDQSLYPLLPYNWEPSEQVTMEKIRSGNLAGTVKPYSITNPVWVDVDGDGALAPSHTIVPQDCQNFTRVDRTNPYVPVASMNCDCVVKKKAPGC